MTSATARVLIIGGNSSIAHHLLALLPDARAIARTAGRAGVTAIGDYRRLRPEDFAEAGIVINCAGIVNGTDAALQAINVDLQVSLAAAARAAGVARYVAIGSFSIFGRRTGIDHNTPVDPRDAYGRSKLAGEDALRDLQTDTFGILSVAFPAIIGTTRAGKVERMLKLWRRIGIWPVPKGDVVRAMIGVEAAARVLACAAVDDRTGRVLAADPVAFRYTAAAQWLRDETGDAFQRLLIPAAGMSLLRWLSPSLHQSMMADSELDPESNYACECGIETSLQRELVAAVVRGSQR